MTKHQQVCNGFMISTVCHHLVEPNNGHPKTAGAENVASPPCSLSRVGSAKRSTSLGLRDPGWTMKMVNLEIAVVFCLNRLL